MNIRNFGISKLFLSAKGTMSLIVLTATFILALFGRIDGMAFAAAMSCVTSVFLFTHAASDIANSQNQGVLGNVVSVVKQELGNKIP